MMARAAGFELTTFCSQCRPLRSVATKNYLLIEGFISNEAGRVKCFFSSFFLTEPLLFFSGHTHPFARKRCFTGRMLFDRRRSLIRVHPTRSARRHFIISVLPTNHLCPWNRTLAVS